MFNFLESILYFYTFNLFIQSPCIHIPYQLPNQMEDNMVKAKESEDPF